jgi:hypothetical protein
LLEDSEMRAKLFAVSIAAFLVLTPLSAQDAKPFRNTNQENRVARSDAPAQATPQSAESAEAIIADNNQASAAPQKSDTNGAQDVWVAHLWSDLKISDILLTLFTGALAIYTYRLWRSTDKLWAAARAQLIEAAKATLAMNASNEITRNAYISEHRPWLTVGDPRFESDIIIEKANLNSSEATLTSSVSVLITNIGKSPAYDVVTFMQSHEVYPDNVALRLETRKEAIRWQSEEKTTKIVLPGEKYRRIFGITFVSMSNGVLIPSIIGSTVYRSVMLEDIHYTDFEFTAGAPMFEGGNPGYRPFDTTKNYDYRQAVWEPGTSSGVA